MQINRYTREVIAPRKVADTVDPKAIARAGSEFKGLAEITGDVAQVISEREQKKQTRYETIQRARAVADYQMKADEEFNKFSQENDLTDPDSVRKFNEVLRKKTQDYIAMHQGGEDSRASLEIQLTGLQDNFTSRMSQASTGAQREFITKQVGGHIDRIAGEVYADPKNLGNAFKQINGLMYEYGAALDSSDELQMMENAQSMVVEGALNSFIDAGNYEDARDFVNENSAFIEKMPAKQQMSILGRINNGVAAIEKERNSLKTKTVAIKNAAKEAGVDLSPNQVFTAATGINETQTPEQKVAAFKQAAGLADNQVTPSIVAKIGFGVDLPSSGEVDMNKERLPDGGYTPKGIGAAIKAPYENAANTKVLVDKVLLQSDEFLNSENKQAGLAAMVSFQKLIDDGAAVREGDIKLSAQGNSAFDNLKLAMDRIEKGGIATPKQIEEMKVSARIFGQSVLEASKTYIDPYLEESQTRGYRMIDIGLPRNAYDNIFANVKTSEDKNKRNSEIEEKAKAAGMTVNEYFTAGAKKYNMKPEDVAKKLGYTGKIQ